MLRQWLPYTLRLQRLQSRIFESSRCISNQAEVITNFKLQDIDPAKLTITKTSHRKNPVSNDKLVFGHTFTGISVKFTIT